MRIAIAFCLFASAALGALAPGLNPPDGSPTAVSVSAESLRQFITLRRHRIVEFERIAQIARMHGVRIWLWGGSAAAFAHDSRWHLVAQSRPGEFREGRLRDRLGAIFRSAQDFDLAIDGNASKVAAVQKALEDAMPGLAYEVRSLHEGHADKDALLSADVLDQCSDSGSRGLIELTGDDPTALTDLLTLAGRGDGEFLRDAAAATLTYIESPAHERTRPFREGRNPRILSVVRYLIKACQFDLHIPDASWAAIVPVAAAFSGSSMPPGRARAWLERQGKKLVMHALDMRRTFALLDALGLRKKLMDMPTDSGDGLLRWWLSREPLRSLHESTAVFPTARSSGISRLAHDTRNLAAWEAITWNPTGVPNFFVTDQAKHRRGVFAARGDAGIHGTGLSVRLNVLPTARLGYDLFVDHYETVIHNRDVVRLVPVDPEPNWESWLDFDRFQENIEQAYVYADLLRDLKNGLLPITEETRAKARQQFESLTAEHLVSPGWTQSRAYLRGYLDLIFAVSPITVEEVYRQYIAALETAEHFHPAIEVESTAEKYFPAVVQEAVQWLFEGYVRRAYATSSPSAKQLRDWFHILTPRIRVAEERKRFRDWILQHLVRSASHALPESEQEHFYYWLRYSPVQSSVDDALFQDAPPEQLARRVAFRARTNPDASELNAGALTLLRTRAATPLLENAAAGHREPEVLALAWVSGLAKEFWRPLLPALQADANSRSRVADVISSWNDTGTSLEREMHVLTAVLQDPLETASEAVVDGLLRAIGSWLDRKFTPTKDLAPSDVDSSALIQQWLHWVDCVEGGFRGSARVRESLEWYAHHFLRTMDESEVATFYRTWKLRDDAVGSRLFQNPTSAGVREMYTAWLAQALARRLKMSLEDANALLDPFIDCLLGQTVSPTPAFWKHFPSIVATARPLLGSGFLRVHGMERIVVEFNQGSEKRYRPTDAARAVRAVFAFYSWEGRAKFMRGDQFEKVWRRLLLVEPLLPHLPSLLLARVGQFHGLLPGASIGRWRKELAAACAKHIVGEGTN